MEFLTTAYEKLVVPAGVVIGVVIIFLGVLAISLVVVENMMMLFEYIITCVEDYMVSKRHEL